jgi:hypothetical protein
VSPWERAGGHTCLGVTDVHAMEGWRGAPIPGSTVGRAVGCASVEHPQTPPPFPEPTNQFHSVDHARPRGLLPPTLDGMTVWRVVPPPGGVRSAGGGMLCGPLWHPWSLRVDPTAAQCTQVRRGPMLKGGAGVARTRAGGAAVRCRTSAARVPSLVPRAQRTHVYVRLLFTSQTLLILPCDPMTVHM